MTFLRALLAAMLFFSSAMALEPGVSQALAHQRAARITNVKYTVVYSLQEHSSTAAAHVLLSFDDSGIGDLPLDFRDGTVAYSAVNNHPLTLQAESGHLLLPAASLVHGHNTVEIAFQANIAPAGKAITRYQDKDDGAEYLYTLFVPMDASMAFPCFDQPDLKARFILSVTHPPAWTVIGNTATQFETTRDGKTTTAFFETQPISTYLFAFAAGPFARIQGSPAIYVRKSQLARAQAEASAVQAITTRGVQYLADYFAQPFPFPKYDLVLIPGFPFGGMEHAGATFLNEDGVLFRTAPTQSDYFRRDILVLHETCHQWFGDLVTMRWFDDLWLKEGFAQYMAYKAMAALKPETAPWKHFYEDIKPLAYGIDETQGTTPIFQQIPNLKDAKSAYGAIVYQKAPAVLKQLNYRLGEQNFRDGLRLYLKQHAYANAQWADLIAAFEATGQQGGQTDVKTWADAWILRRGMPEVTVEWTCTKGRLTNLTLRQHDVLADGYVWPIANKIRMGQDDGIESTHRVTWSGPQHTERALDNQRCPAYVFANDDDEAYGRFPLDAVSERSVTHLLGVGNGPTDAHLALLHTQLWGALWDNVRAAKTSPRSYADLALIALPGENDESLNRIQGARLAAALHSYMGPESRTAILPRAEAVAADRMLDAPTLGLRIVNFRTFTSIAETPAALAQLKALLDGTLTVPGMPLKPLDRWNLVGHLIAQADPQAEELAAKERGRDQSGESQKYAYATAAGAADLHVKSTYFDQYRTDQTVQEDWLTQSLGPFNSWNQTALTEPYLARALDLLPDIKAHRKIFFLGAWLNAFVGGQHSAEAQGIVHTWLARKDLDPDLRLKVLQVSDELDRTVMIRQRYPK